RVAAIGRGPVRDGLGRVGRGTTGTRPVCRGVRAKVDIGEELSRRGRTMVPPPIPFYDEIGGIVVEDR
ncbi:hypothetical protein KI387_030777, partial [Taxus chinensis]